MRRFTLTPLLLALALAGPSVAATHTWVPKTTLGAATPWDVAGNWSTGQVPDSANDMVRFTRMNNDPAVYFSVLLQRPAGYAVQGLFFEDSGAVPGPGSSLSYEIKGSPLTLGAGGIAGRANSLTLSGPVRLSADQNWGNISAANGNLDLAGHKLTTAGGVFGTITSGGGEFSVAAGATASVLALTDTTFISTAGTVRASRGDALALARVGGLQGSGSIGLATGELNRVGHFNNVAFGSVTATTTLEVGGLNNPGTMLVRGDLRGEGTLVKMCRALLKLTDDSTMGQVIVEAGQLLQEGGSFSSDVFVRGGGSLRSSNARLDLAGHRIEIAAPATMLVQGGSASGGELLRSAGELRVGLASRYTSWSGLVTRSGSTLVFAGGDNTFSNARISGVMRVDAIASVETDNLDLRPGAVLNLYGNLAARHLESPAAITLGTTGLLDVVEGDLILAAGSRTTLGSKAAPGGLIDLRGNDLHLYSGLLVNNGSILNGTTFVHYGSLAKGAGTYADLRVEDGGRMIAGNSPGTLHAGALSWGEGGGFEFQLADALAGGGIGHGLVQVDGTLRLTAPTEGAGRFVLHLQTLDAQDQPGLATRFDAGQAYRWTFAEAAAIDDFDARRFVIDRSGFLNAAPGSFTVQMDGQRLDLVYAPVPEPGPAALLAAGLTVLSLQRRRRPAR